MSLAGWVMSARSLPARLELGGKNPIHKMGWRARAQGGASRSCETRPPDARYRVAVAPSIYRRSQRLNMIRIATRAAGAVVAAVLILTGCALGYRAWRQHENALALAIDKRTGIEETMFVPLGGVEQ